MTDLTSEESDQQTDTEQKVLTTKKRCSCWKCLFWTISITIAVVAAFFGYVYIQVRERVIPSQIAEQLGAEGIQMFYAFDRDNDGYLSVAEFEPLFHRMAGRNFSVEIDEYNVTVNATDEVLTVTTAFEPFELDTLTRSSTDGPGIEDDVLFGLRAWKKPYHDWMNFGVQHFGSFFPPEGYRQSFGEVYNILLEDMKLMSMINLDPSSNRYFPALVKDSQVIFHRLFTMFHPRPFILCRFKPRGGYAIVRAVNQNYIDIVFRIHAEFQLHEPPRYPFWFTPGQFTGNLIVSSDLKHIAHFHMYVPNKRRLNVDMEWYHNGENMEVDIGYVPKMELNITAPSVPAADFNMEGRVPDKPFTADSIVWDKEISLEEAHSKLQLEMYPFTKVKYYNFTETFDLARKEDKLVHSIMLWGALDDQSC